MKVFVFMILVLLCAVPVLAETSEIPATSPVIRVQALQAGVVYSTQGEDMFLPEGQSLEFGGDFKIRTDPSGRALLDFYGEAKMILKEASEAKIGINSIMLRQGDSWLRFVKRGSSFKIKTPSAVLGIRGTTFNLSVNEAGDTTVKLLEGEVSVKTNKEEMILQPGQTLNVSQKTGHAEVAPTEEKVKDEIKGVNRFLEFKLEEGGAEAVPLDQQFEGEKGQPVDIKPIEGLEDIMRGE